MKKKYLIFLTFLLLTSCSSSPHKAEKLDTKIENSKNAGNDSVIGIKDGNMVFQKKVLLGEELRSLTVNVREMEAKLYGGPRYFDNNGLIGALRSCRAKLASVKGEKLQWTERRDYVIPENENLKMGVDEKGELAGVSEEFLKDRLDRYRGYQQILTQRTDEMEEKIASCNSQLQLEAKSKSDSNSN